MTDAERAERNGKRREQRQVEREKGQIAVAVEQVTLALQAVAPERRARVIRAVAILLDVDLGPAVAGETLAGG